MLDAAYALSDALLGLSIESQELEWHHMALRAVVVYLIVLAITRSGHKRFLGKGTAFDVLVGILLGSIASRAITGNAAFFPALVACGVLVWLHAIFAWSTYRSPRIARTVEGDAIDLVRDGSKLSDEMRRTDVTEQDLQEAMYMRGVADVGEVRLARLERSGKISVIAKRPQQS